MDEKLGVERRKKKRINEISWGIGKLEEKKIWKK